MCVGARRGRGHTVVSFTPIYMDILYNINHFHLKTPLRATHRTSSIESVTPCEGIRAPFVDSAAADHYVRLPTEQERMARYDVPRGNPRRTLH